MITIRQSTGTNLAKVVGKRQRENGVTVWIVRPRYGKRYSSTFVEVTADEILGEPPVD